LRNGAEVATYFFDSSAIVKRYVQETGTGWLNGIVDPAAHNELWLARITGVEMVSAMARRQRGGGLSSTAASLALSEFRHEFGTEFRLIEVTPALVTQAMRLAEAHALRGYEVGRCAGS
jgi:predicted nucleic acid-binding protein